MLSSNGSTQTMSTYRMLSSKIGVPSKFWPPRRLKCALSSKSTQWKTNQNKYVFKTSFDGRSGLFQTTLISHCLTSLLPKPTLILAKSLTSDPYNRGILFRRKSVIDEFRKNRMLFYWKSSQIVACRVLLAGCRGKANPSGASSSSSVCRRGHERRHLHSSYWTGGENLGQGLASIWPANTFCWR